MAECAQKLAGYNLNYRRTLQSRLRGLAIQSGVKMMALAGLPKLPCAVPRETVVPEVEFEAVLRCAPPWLEIMMLLAHEAGLRHKAAALLTRSNCDFEEERIHGTTKGGARYDVPMTARLRDRLMWYCAAAQFPDEPLSAVYRMPRKVPTENTVRCAICAARKRAGVANVWGMHDLRRSAARRLYSKTHDIRKVQAMLGHKMLWTTCWYLGNATSNLTAEDMESGQLTAELEKKLA